MADPINPGAAKTFGLENYIIVPAVASKTAPTVAEVNAATGLDVSCYLFGDPAAPSQQSNIVTTPRRHCETVQYGQIGITTYTGGELMMAFGPQATAGSDDKKAWEKFKDGYSGFMIRRQALDIGTTPAAGQFVDVIPIEIGPCMPVNVGSGEESVAGFTGTYTITGKPEWNVAIAA